MKIQVDERDNVSIIRLDGRLSTGSGDVSLRQEIRNLLDAGNKAILLDLKHVKSIDSGGVGELVSSFTTSRNAGASLKLLHLPEKVLAVFQMTQLITVFETYNEEEEAIRSF